MNSESADAKAHLYAEMNDAMEAAETLGAFNIVTINESHASNTEGNWLYAVGAYRTWARGKVSTTGNNCYKMEWSFFFRDNYDWELDDYDSPYPNGGGGVYDYELALLDRYAYRSVSEYEMVGQQDFVITWKKGQRFDEKGELSAPPRRPR